MDMSEEFNRYVVQLSTGLGHAARHAGLSGYCAGPLSRHSVKRPWPRMLPRDMPGRGIKLCITLSQIQSKHVNQSPAT
jgi:hypothetical protein